MARLQRRRSALRGQRRGSHESAAGQIHAHSERQTGPAGVGPEPPGQGRQSVAGGRVEMRIEDRGWKIEGRTRACRDIRARALNLQPLAISLRPSRAFLLLECLVYIGGLSLVLGLAYA